jgi:hypothetical protein
VTLNRVAATDRGAVRFLDKVGSGTAAQSTLGSAV